MQVPSHKSTIIDAAITVLIPIFHRLSNTTRIAPEEGRSFVKSTSKIDAEIGTLRRRIEELDRMRQQRVKIEGGFL